jgi:hypothetical protein
MSIAKRAQNRAIIPGDFEKNSGFFLVGRLARLLRLDGKGWLGHHPGTDGASRWLSMVAHRAKQGCWG